MVYSGAWGTLIHKKTRSRKSRDTVPLSIPPTREPESVLYDVATSSVGGMVCQYFKFFQRLFTLPDTVLAR